MGSVLRERGTVFNAKIFGNFGELNTAQMQLLINSKIIITIIPLLMDGEIISILHTTEW